MTTKVLLVPFDPHTGHQQHYPEHRFESNGEGGWNKLPPVWKENCEFDATLEMKGYSRGRSAAYFNLEDDQGNQYTMFLKDLVDAFPAFRNGKAKGTWCYCKRGQNYGVKYVG